MSRHPDTGNPRGRVVRKAERTRVAATALVAAGLIVAACVTPLALWGNPFPAGVVEYWALGTVVLGVVAAIAGRLPARPTRAHALSAAMLRPSPLGFAAMVAATTIVISCVLATYAFRRAATTSDEIAQLWHARILLTGRFYLPPDPNPEFFALENVIDVGRWYSQFPIGGPLVLTAGAALGAPWLMNPILAGIAAAMIYSFARDAFGELEGRAVAALFSVTPMVLFMAGTWMNHVPVLCLATIVLAALARWNGSTGTNGPKWAAVIGLALGLMATIRPLDAIIVAVPVGIFQLWRVHADRGRLRELAAQVLCGVAGVAPLLYANAATTGRPFRFGYEVMWGAGHQLGFRTDPYGNVHTVGRALEYAMTYVSELNMYLMAWPMPALVVVIGALLAMRRVSRWDVLLLGLFFAQVAAYASYSLVGEFLGPRFLYTAVPTLIVLVARAPFLIGDRLGPRWRQAAVAFTVASIVAAWSLVPARFSAAGLAKQVRGTRQSMKLDVAGTVQDAKLENALIFLREPLSGRLLRRLWGVGMSRSDAAQLLEWGDSCSLLTALRSAEADSAAVTAMKVSAILRGTERYRPGDQVPEGIDPTVRISSPSSLTPECLAELEADSRIPSVPFGPALPLQPIGPDGRIGGNVIYAADLGERNEVLRGRFGDRRWYRLTTVRAGDGTLRAVIAPYR